MKVQPCCTPWRPYIGGDHNLIDVRFPVQYVVRPMSDEYHDYRGYAGRVSGGVMKPGDTVMHLPSGLTSRSLPSKPLMEIWTKHTRLKA